MQGISTPSLLIPDMLDPRLGGRQVTVGLGGGHLKVFKENEVLSVGFILDL